MTMIMQRLEPSIAAHISAPAGDARMGGGGRDELLGILRCRLVAAAESYDCGLVVEPGSVIRTAGELLAVADALRVETGCQEANDD